MSDKQIIQIDEVVTKMIILAHTGTAGCGAFKVSFWLFLRF